MRHAAVGIWLLSALVCAGRAHATVSDTAGQDTALDSSSTASAVSLVTAANKGFAYRLYKKLAAQPDSQGKNIFFSPASVSLALAALSVGARGETHQQLFSGLGFNGSVLTQTDVDQAFSTILERANKTNHEDCAEGTAIFLDNLFKPQPEFLETLKQSYLAEGFNVDFAKTTDSTNTINNYIAEKTNGKIDKLVDHLDPSTLMYLISYIYYKGKWATPFDPGLTQEDEFNVDENTKVQVQMMSMKKTLGVYFDKAINTSVLHLPFNSSYSMLLLLPDNMATLENAISPGHITKWLKWKKFRKYQIYVPKFSIKTYYKLNNVLTEMGITDIFGDRADLSGISPGQKVAVSEVVHQATLDVDEVGATAAGATGIGILPLSYHHPGVLKFNHPFIVAVIECKTENMLFFGKIVNPNQ
ncbi:Serpin A3-5 Precursor [Channa argus]|uniref:Thyroxine-binding globulin n=1 Tax=Channa argus TaxID=215402 RepID=A0A6G1Q179_CHAAH|nr:Serpin A3-5 Precursor [Channa argus]